MKYGSVSPHCEYLKYSTNQVSSAEKIAVKIRIKDFVVKCINIILGLTDSETNIKEVKANKCQPLTTDKSNGDVISTHTSRVIKFFNIMLIFII